MLKKMGEILLPPAVENYNVFGIQMLAWQIEDKNQKILNKYFP